LLPGLWRFATQPDCAAQQGAWKDCVGAQRPAGVTIWPQLRKKPGKSGVSPGVASTMAWEWHCQDVRLERKKVETQGRRNIVDNAGFDQFNAK